MDVGLILSILQKGLQLIPTLIEVGQDVGPVVKDLIQVAQGAKEGTITDADLTALEARLDALIEDFNAPMA